MTAADTEWRAWRSRGIGASEVAGILGISPWQTPYSVWQSKVNGGTSGTGGNAESMRWGQLLEHAILAELERRLDLHVAGEQTWCTHRAHPWAIATVDAFFGESPEFAIADALGVVEVKTTSEPRWDEVPAHYAAQVQWQLEVTDLDHAWVACLHNGRRLSLWPIERDRDVGAGLLEVVEDFWTRSVQGGEPPPVDGRPATSAALAARYADTEPDLVADLSAVAPELDTLRLLRAEIDMLTEEKDRLENVVKQAMGPAVVGELDSVRAVTWKPSTSKRVDTVRLREELPTLAAQYSTETTTRRFLLAKQKGTP
jgi:putative phage-type endonuclease